MNKNKQTSCVEIYPVEALVQQHKASGSDSPSHQHRTNTHSRTIYSTLNHYSSSQSPYNFQRIQPKQSSGKHFSYHKASRRVHFRRRRPHYPSLLPCFHSNTRWSSLPEIDRYTCRLRREWRRESRERGRR